MMSKVAAASSVAHIIVALLSGAICSCCFDSDVLALCHVAIAIYGNCIL